MRNTITVGGLGARKRYAYLPVSEQASVSKSV